MTDAQVALLIFGAAQTGALIYFAGVISATVRNHDARIEKLETGHLENLKAVSQLTGREG